MVIVNLSAIKFIIKLADAEYSKRDFKYNLTWWR